MGANWREDYEHFLLEPMTKDSGIFSQVEYDWKRNNFPKIFYKYGNLDTDYYMDSIKNDYIYLNSIDKFEDPFECAASVDYKYVYDISKVKIADYVEAIKPCITNFMSEAEFNIVCEESIYKKLPIDEFINTIFEKCHFNCEDLQQRAREGLKRIKSELFEAQFEIYDNHRQVIQNSFLIGCLIENNFATKMWTKYANDFTGICIEYDISNIIVDCFPVYYYNEFFSYSEMCDKDLYYYAICRKLKKWEFEQELRIICDKEKGNCLNFPAKSICVSEKCLRVHDIITLAQEKQIPLYSVKSTDLSSGRYRIA